MTDQMFINLDINKQSRTEAQNINNQNASRLTRTIIVQKSLNDPKEVELNSTIVLNLVDKSLTLNLHHVIIESYAT